jgi:predicted ATPase
MICIDYLLFIFEIKVIEIGDWMILNALLNDLEKTIMLIYLS